jgi:hypothetical protein
VCLVGIDRGPPAVSRRGVGHVPRSVEIDNYTGQLHRILEKEVQLTVNNHKPELVRSLGCYACGRDLEF